MGSLSTFKASAVDACSNPSYTWAVGAGKLADAIDLFMKTAIISTSVTGAGVTPSGAPIVVAAVPGTLTALTILGAPAMKSAIVTAYTNPVWAGIGSSIANAINAYITTGSITTSVAVPPFVGTGSGVFIIPPSTPEFIMSMELLYTTPTNTWAQIGSDMADAIHRHLGAILCPTTDIGTAPPNGWAGTGVTTFTWN